METSAGEPLISVRPIAVTKCSSWLVSAESPLLWGSKPCYIEFCYILSSPYSTAQHTNSVLNIMGRQNNRAGMSACGQVIWRGATDGQWAVKSPWMLHSGLQWPLSPSLVPISECVCVCVELCVRCLVCPHSAHLLLCICLYIELIYPRIKKGGIFFYKNWTPRSCREMRAVDPCCTDMSIHYLWIEKNYSYEVVILVFVPLCSQLPHHSPITTSCEALRSLLLTNLSHAQM